MYRTCYTILTQIWNATCKSNGSPTYAGVSTWPSLRHKERLNGPPTCGNWIQELWAIGIGWERRADVHQTVITAVINHRSLRFHRSSRCIDKSTVIRLSSHSWVSKLPAQYFFQAPTHTWFPQLGVVKARRTRLVDVCNLRFPSRGAYRSIYTEYEFSWTRFSPVFFW